MGIFDKAKKQAEQLKEKSLTALAQEKLNNFAESEKQKKNDKKEKEEILQEKENQFIKQQESYTALFRPTKIMGDIEIDEINELLKINHASSNIKKEKGKLAKTGKAALAIATYGASLAVESVVKKKADDVIFSFNEIADYDLIENDISVASGGLGRALVGGATFGSTGAIVGGLTGKKKTKKSVDRLALQISTNEFYFPSIIITYITKETKTSSSTYIDAYNHAKETMACLDIIFKKQKDKVSQKSESVESGIDAYEEIKKAKELLDMGIISEEEFNEKKIQLLNLK